MESNSAINIGVKLCNENISEIKCALETQGYLLKDCIAKTEKFEKYNLQLKKKVIENKLNKQEQ